MESSPEQAIPVVASFNRRVFFVEDRRDAYELEQLLRQGWKIDDKWFKPVRMEGKVVLHLLQFLQPTVQKADLKPVFDDEDLGVVEDKREVAGYGTVFIPHLEGSDPTQPWIEQGYVLLHKDHITSKGTILTLLQPKGEKKE